MIARVTLMLAVLLTSGALHATPLSPTPLDRSPVCVPDFTAKRTDVVYADSRSTPIRTTSDGTDCVPASTSHAPAPTPADRYVAAHRGPLSLQESRGPR